MISIFDLAAILLALSALFGWLNRRFLRLPNAIGLLVLGLTAALLLLLLELLFPGQQFYAQTNAALQQIDFTQVVFNGMLAFLLFAGARNLDFGVLRDRALPVTLLAVGGTIVSTVIVALLFWCAARLLGAPLSLPWAFVFGALISPTDPVAVLQMLKDVRIPATLKIETEGEALFNDGVGVVLFTLLLGIATGTDAFSVNEALVNLLREAGGGLLLGLVTGYVAYRALRAIDDFPVEVLITLALVTGTYALAGWLGVSGPLATVAAGVLVGYRAPQDAMSDLTQQYVSALWTLIDEILNSVLFLLIGLEVLVLTPDPRHFGLAALAIPIALVARLAAVSAPLLLPVKGVFMARNVPFLTWAGVRGGISVALALALPPSEARPIILAATYAVVVFTIVIQGATLRFIAPSTMPGG
ncbi:MAG TPA: sodium:proton antiporter [Devosia sp.]|nr:sodium:proton antiporter [Devosia sp.]